MSKKGSITRWKRMLKITRRCSSDRIVINSSGSSPLDVEWRKNRDVNSGDSHDIPTGASRKTAVMKLDGDGNWRIKANAQVQCQQDGGEGKEWHWKNYVPDSYQRRENYLPGWFEKLKTARNGSVPVFVVFSLKRRMPGTILCVLTHHSARAVHATSIERARMSGSQFRGFLSSVQIIFIYFSLARLHPLTESRTIINARAPLVNFPI